MHNGSPSRLDWDKKFNLSGERWHRVTQFGDCTYKITQHYGCRFLLPVGPKAPAQHSDVKLSSSISRTRRLILEYALANDWDYFITMTLDKEKGNRFDLEGWRKRFNEWLKYRRKEFGLKVAFILVPEQHGDGAWHAHGLIRGLDLCELEQLSDLKDFGPGDLCSFESMDKLGYRTARGKRLPRKLVTSGYFNWPAFQNSFGYVSLGRLKCKEAASFYVTKYITKDLARCVDKVGGHIYWKTAGLNKPQNFGVFYDRNTYIDSLLVNKYEFCATGFVMPQEGWCSDLAAELIESVGGEVFAGSKAHPLFESTEEPAPAELEADAFAAMEQLVFKM